MGHGIMGKDRAPFATELPIYERRNFGEDEQMLLFEPENILDIPADELTINADFSDPDHPVMKGWRLADPAGDFGVKKDVHAPEWEKKGKFRVWLLNESQYNNVGEYEITVCAYDEMSIHEFLMDFADMFPNALSVQVIQDKIILQWG